MLNTTYDVKKKCAYVKDNGEYAGTIYSIYSVEVKEVGAHKKVTFYNTNGIPTATLFCDYSELKTQDDI